MQVVNTVLWFAYLRQQTRVEGILSAAIKECDTNLHFIYLIARRVCGRMRARFHRYNVREKKKA